MLESWEMIRHVAEVLGMIFLPILGWMLFTLNNHSKKIILLGACERNYYNQIKQSRRTYG